MNGWDRLGDELDAWQDAGRTATLWWRDDDATCARPELRRLVELHAAYDVPVALAVIPRDADVSLQDLLDGRPGISVLQHGWSHQNHAPEGQRQEEYGPHRARDDMMAELAEGWRRTRALPGALPVLVAPWNRMDPELTPYLPRAGLGAVSTLGPRPAASPAPDVRQTNVHVDIMDWAGSGGFIGDDRALDQVVRHLQARRQGEADDAEPTGLMTHHGFHDEGCWQFIATFLDRTRAHPAAAWLGAAEAFWP